MGTGRGYLTQGGVKSRDLSCGGMVIEIRRARSDRNAAGYPYCTFYLEEIFCAHVYTYVAPTPIETL